MYPNQVKCGVVSTGWPVKKARIKETASIILNMPKVKAIAASPKESSSPSFSSSSSGSPPKGGVVVMRRHAAPVTCRTLDVESVSEVKVEQYDTNLVPMPASAKPVVNKRTSWGRIKKMFVDTAILSSSKNSDGHNKKSKRGSLDLDYEPLVNIRSNNNSMNSGKDTISTSRKMSNPVFRRSPRSNHHSLEDMLHVAIMESDEVGISKLIQDHDLDVNLIHEMIGCNALHQACVLGNVNVIRILLQKGGDVSVRTCEGLSPLQIATLSGNFDAAQYLLQQGACSKDVEDGISIDQMLFPLVAL